MATNATLPGNCYEGRKNAEIKPVMMVASSNRAMGSQEEQPPEAHYYFGLPLLFTSVANISQRGFLRYPPKQKQAESFHHFPGADLIKMKQQN